MMTVGGAGPVWRATAIATRRLEHSGPCRAASRPVIASPMRTTTRRFPTCRGQVAATNSADYESKAVLLHALTIAGKNDFTLANRLYRSRPSLSPASLLYVALTFAEMDRDATAKELLAAVANMNLDKPVNAEGGDHWAAAVEQQPSRAAGAVRHRPGKSGSGIATDSRDGGLADRSPHGASLGTRQSNRPGSTRPVPVVCA